MFKVMLSIAKHKQNISFSQEIPTVAYPGVVDNATQIFFKTKKKF